MIDVTIDLGEFISNNSEHSASAVSEYNIEMKFKGEIITELPCENNLFVYGSGRVGKTTLLRSIIGKDKRIYLYLNLKDSSYGILLRILLKYRYL